MTERVLVCSNDTVWRARSSARLPSCPHREPENAVGQALNERLPGSKAHGDRDTVVLESPLFRTI